MNIMFAGFFGGWEIVLILAVVLILFGAKKLPELAKGLGTGIKEFKKATNEVTSEIQRAGEMDDQAHRQVSYRPAEQTIEASSSPAQPTTASTPPSQQKT